MTQLVPVSSLSSYLITHTINECIVIFSVRPGDGKEFVYSPVDVNATIHCAVNASLLSWQINSTLSLSNDVQRPQLNSKGIFENGPRTDSSGVTESSVTIFGDEIINNNTEICCQTAVNTFIAQNCTTLITYGKTIIMVINDCMHG